MSTPRQDALRRIGELLAAEGYPTNLTDVEGGDGPLIVPFREDAKGREMVLFIESFPQDADDRTTILCFSLVYPVFIPDGDALPELVRLLFLLNRLLPIGQHGFAEDAPAVTFRYNLLVKDPLAIDAEVVLDAVDMIGMFTRDHGEMIDQVLTGDLDCEAVLDQMEAAGFELPPLFSRSLATV